MVAALSKILPDDFGGRFSAWWNGNEYTPPEPDADGAEDGAETSADEGAAPVQMDPAASRIAALETLWGEGRFSPGSSELYSRITEGMSAFEGGADRRFGVLNGDPALTQHFMGISGVCPVIAEWRAPCADRFREVFSDFDVVRGDIDRPAFEPGSLSLLVSQDGFTYADHKSGLAVRALRSLEPGGQWVVIDTVRGNAKGALAPAFASSWAEPQLCEQDEIEDVADAAGFEVSSSVDDISGDVIQACRSAFERFGQDLENRLASRLEGVNKQIFVRELAWEAGAWKWRQRALAGELIHTKVWKFRKPT